MKKSQNLQQLLSEHYANWASTASSEKKELIEGSIRQLLNDGVHKDIIKVGEKVPNSTLLNVYGNEENLRELLSKQELSVLLWYRGGWCPYCNLTLRAYQNIEPNLNALNTQLIALSPELPDNSLSTKEKAKLSFHVLSDFGNALAEKLGLSYKLNNNLAKMYNKVLKLDAHNGNTSSTLPIPATIVVDKEAIVRYIYANPDYRVRLEPEDLLRELDRIKQNSYKPGIQ